MPQYILLFLSLLLLAACMDSDSTVDLEERYQQGEVAWHLSGIRDYQFNYEETGFSPLQGVWQIMVAQSEISSVQYLGEDSPTVGMNTDTAPTVDALYDRIKDCINNQSCELVQLVLNTNYPVPETVSFSSGSDGSGF